MALAKHLSATEPLSKQMAVRRPIFSAIRCISVRPLLTDPQEMRGRFIY